MVAGPLATTEAFEKNLAEKGVEGVSAKYFPAVVMSTVGGQICQTLSLKGINSTLVDGIGAGLPGAIHAFEMLRASDKEDQVILVAPDEISPWLHRSLDLSGLLSDQTDGAGPYHQNARGFLMGEGSIALVFERLESAQARGARIYAEVLGVGANCDTRNVFDETISPHWMEKCQWSALHNSSTQPDEIDFAVGIGSGIPAYDVAERTAFQRVLGGSIPISLPVSLLGLGLASCGAAALAVAALGLSDQQVYLPAAGNWKKPESFRKALVFGGSEVGNNSAIVLGRPT
jgi:3-oxoacyl-(acyl-carrier-protein) synthase